MKIYHVLLSGRQKVELVMETHHQNAMEIKYETGTNTVTLHCVPPKIVYNIKYSIILLMNMLLRYEL